MEEGPKSGLCLKDSPKLFLREWPAMYVSWTENLVLWRNCLGIIWDQWDVFTVHICSAWAQIQSLKSSTIVYFRWVWESAFNILFNKEDEKCSKNSTVNKLVV